MDNSRYSGVEVYKLIPQRPPMVMIDSFDGFVGEISLTSLKVTNTNILCCNEEFSESGIIEHIAQSTAARVGFISITNNKEIPLGFIGSVDKLQIIRKPKNGETLFTRIKVIQHVFGITLIGAEVYSNDELIAKGNMKIFLQEDEEK